MKGLLFVLIWSVAWCDLGFAQEVLQGASVKPSSVFMYETFDLGKGAITQTSEQTILSASNERAKVQVVTSTGQKWPQTLDLTNHSMPWSHSQGTYDLVRFPSKVGDKWDWTASHALNGNGDRSLRETWEMSAKFVGWEDVEVPAGKFRSAKIEHVGFWKLSNGGQGARLEVTVWYAPDVGRIVKRKEVHWGWREIETQFEVRLVKYQPAPGSIVSLVKAD